MQIIPLYKKEDYPYNTPGNFVPTLTAVLNEGESVRPAMIIIPGGAYLTVSPAEGILIAQKFRDLGYNCFVLTATMNVNGMFSPLRKQPFHDLEKAVRFIRKEHERFHIDPEKVVVHGFSGGGHIAVTLLCHADEEGKEDGISAKPNAFVFSYPVIDTEKFDAVKKCLFGDEPTEEEMNWVSAVKNIPADAPPCFIWHTNGDIHVPPENSIILERALAEKGIFRELHIFATGHHGESLATEEWKAGNYPSDDAVAQYAEAIRHEIEHRDGSFRSALFDIEKITDPEEAIALQKASLYPSADAEVNESLQIWPVLCDTFLKNVLK